MQKIEFMKHIVNDVRAKTKTHKIRNWFDRRAYLGEI